MLNARGETLMVRLALLNWRRAPMTAGFIAIMTVVHPAQSQETKPAEPTVAAANRAVQSQLPFGDRQDFEDAMRDSSRQHPTWPIWIAGHF
jgi:alkyl sulfatase BDS1-like metallo-beta-lactamase superfamily hydrolase